MMRVRMSIHMDLPWRRKRIFIHSLPIQRENPSLILCQGLNESQRQWQAIAHITCICPSNHLLFPSINLLFSVHLLCLRSRFSFHCQSAMNISSYPPSIRGFRLPFMSLNINTATFSPLRVMISPAFGVKSNQFHRLWSRLLIDWRVCNDCSDHIEIEKKADDQLFFTLSKTYQITQSIDINLFFKKLASLQQHYPKKVPILIEMLIYHCILYPSFLIIFKRFLKECVYCIHDHTISEEYKYIYISKTSCFQLLLSKFTQLFGSL